MAVDFSIVHEQAFYCGNCGRGWDRMRIVSAGQQHSFRRFRVDEPIHQLLLATQCGNGIAICQSLAINGEIRHHTRNLCIAGNPVAKPGLDLIKNEDKAVLVGQSTESVQISDLRLDDPEILENRLRDQCRCGILLTDILY